MAGELPPGTEVAGYRIESVLGRGGMGSVYLAEDVRLHRRVALKVLAPELAADERFRTRFVRESELAAGLDHPNVVPIYQAGEADGVLYLAMRYVRGTDLKRVLTQGPLPPDRAASIVRQVAAALDSAHVEGLVHRDVKPANVLLLPAEGTQGEHAYLSDFGLTKRTSSNSGLTGTGQFIGTLDYVAPEQIRGEPVDGRTDVYSLACMAFEVLTGRVPFVRDNDVAILWAHINEPPPSAAAVRADLPEVVDEVLAQGMAKAPGDRYGTAGAFAGALSDAVGGSAGTPPADSAPTKDRTPSPPAAAARRTLARSARGGPWTWIIGGVVAILVIVPLAAVLASRGGGPGKIGASGSPSSPTPAIDIEPNSVVRIDAQTGRIQAVIPVGTLPSRIATVGNEVWVVNEDDHTYSRIDPETNSVTDTVGLDVVDLAVADDGTVWALGDATATHIDPHTLDTIGTIHLKTPRLNTAEMAVALDGSLWVEESVKQRGHGRQTVAQYEIPSGKLLRRVEVGTLIGDIAAGEGAVWVASYDDDHVTRIDPVDGTTKEIESGTGPLSLVVAYGAVWVDNFFDETLARIDPTTLRATDFIEIGSGPQGVSAGNGYIWVQIATDATVTQIETNNDRVTRTISMGSTVPEFSTFAAGSMWVSVQRE